MFRTHYAVPVRYFTINSNVTPRLLDPSINLVFAESILVDANALVVELTFQCAAEI